MLGWIWTGFFETIRYRAERKEIFFSVSVKKNSSGLNNKRVFEINSKSWQLIFSLSFSKHGLPIFLGSLSATARGNMKCLKPLQRLKKEVTGRHCLIGISDVFATDKVFGVPSWIWTQTLKTYVAIIWNGTISTEMDALLSSRKTISSLEGKFVSVSFRKWLYRKKNQLIGVAAYVTPLVNLLIPSLLFVFRNFSD